MTGRLLGVLPAATLAALAASGLAAVEKHLRESDVPVYAWGTLVMGTGWALVLGAVLGALGNEGGMAGSVAGAFRDEEERVDNDEEERVGAAVVYACALGNGGAKCSSVDEYARTGISTVDGHADKPVTLLAGNSTAQRPSPLSPPFTNGDKTGGRPRALLAGLCSTLSCCILPALLPADLHVAATALRISLMLPLLYAIAWRRLEYAIRWNRVTCVTLVVVVASVVNSAAWLSGRFEWYTLATMTALTAIILVPLSTGDWVAREQAATKGMRSGALLWWRAVVQLALCPVLVVVGTMLPHGNALEDGHSESVTGSTGVSATVHYNFWRFIGECVRSPRLFLLYTGGGLLSALAYWLEVRAVKRSSAMDGFM